MTLLDYLPLLASETTASGEGVALPAGMAYAFGALPVLLADDPEWQVRVVRPPTMTVVETIVPSADAQVGRTFDESHLEQANELGKLSFSTFDVDGFDIEPGDLVEFIERGFTIGGGVIRQATTEKVSRQAEGKPFTTWTGTRPLGVLEEAPILPARGEGSTARDRVWGWFGITFDDSTWVPAAQAAAYGSGRWWSTEADLDEFYDTSAYWVWARRRAGDPPLDEWSPQAQHLFRQTGTVPAGVTQVEIEWTADAVGEAYFEGESIGSVQWGEGTKRVRVSVVPGAEVLFAIAGTNDVDPEGDEAHNPGGLMWSVWAVSPTTGQRETVIMHSDSSAVVLEYVTVRPGVTAGEVLLEVLGEVQALGFIPWVSATFTGEVDSNGRPWAEYGEIGTKAGYSLWKLTQQLTSIYIDTDLTPGTNEWHAWSKGTRGSGRNVTLAATTDPDTSNVTRHVRTRTHTRATDVFSYSEFGWLFYSGWDGSSRRIAATIEYGSLKSQDAVERYAQADLDEYGEDRVEHDVDIIPVSDADKPYWGYGIGDTVTIDGDTEPVVEIGWRRDDNGVLWWDYDGEDG